MYTSETIDPLEGYIFAFATDDYAAYACIQHRDLAKTSKIWRVRFKPETMDKLGLVYSDYDFPYETFHNIEHFIAFVRLNYITNSNFKDKHGYLG